MTDEANRRQFLKEADEIGRKIGWSDQKMRQAPPRREIYAADLALSVGIHELLDALEKRIDAIEAKGVEYKGVWQAAQDYRRGDLVTLDGSMWHANTTTRAKPGNGKAWTLAVKRGVDAR